MNGKECRATRREIDESELGQQLSEQARTHVVLCATCRGFQAERTSLRELVGSLEPVAAPGDFEMRLRARIAREPSGRTQSPGFFRFLTSTPAIAAAALVLMLAVSLVWFVQRNANQVTSTAPTPLKEAPRATNNTQNQVAVNNQGEAVKSTDSSKPTATSKGTRPDRIGNRSPEIDNNIAQSEIKATDYGISPAETIRRGEQRPGEVSLSAPLNPMVVSMRDDHGATRRISLPPVSFGAQRLVDNRVPVSFSKNSRSW
jgi:hypothetical protein